MPKRPSLTPMHLCGNYVRQQGRRPQDAIRAAQPDVVAAAITLTVLEHLARIAREYGHITEDEVRSTINHFLLSSNIRQTEDRMGSIVYERFDPAKPA